MLYNKFLYHTSGDLVTSPAFCKSVKDDGFLIGGGNCIGNNFIIRCDDNANVIWSKQYRVTGTTAVATVKDVIEENGNYTFCGNGLSVANNDNDVYIVKIDDNGNVLKSKGFINIGAQENPDRIIRLSNGNYVLKCAMQTTNQDNFYYFVDSGLTTVSNKKYVFNLDHHYSLVEAANNNIMIAGNTQPTSTSSNKSLLVISLDNSGNVSWSKQSDGITSTQFYDEFWGACTRQDKNGMVAFGQSYGDKAIGMSMDAAGNGFCNPTPVTLTTTTPFTPTVQNAVITITNLPVSITNGNLSTTDSVNTRNIKCGSLAPESIFNTVKQKVNIFPNPANNIITINNCENAIIEIVNLNGQIVYTTKNTNKESATIAINNLVSGCYIVRIKNNKEVKIGSFIKE